MKSHIFKYFSFFALLLVSISNLSAQNGISKLERTILNNSLYLVENYEVLSAVNDEEAYYEFIDLFENPKMPIYNDLLGVYFKHTITVQEYADLFAKKVRSKNVSLRNIQKENMVFMDSIWRVTYTFDKVLTYSNTCGVYFSSEEFYQNVYKYTADVDYHLDTETYKISKLMASVHSSNRLEEGFYTFTKTDERDDDLLYNRQKMHFNAFNQAFLNQNVNISQFKYQDPDVKAIPIQDDQCRTIQVRYKNARFMVLAHGDFGVSQPLVFSSNNVDAKSSSNNYGLDFGYVFPSKTKVKFGVLTGVNYSSTKLETSLERSDYTYQANSSQDVNGETYIRHYTKLQLGQNYDIKDISVPLYVDLDWHFSKIVSCYLDLGVNFDFNLAHKLGSISGSTYIYGIYPQYGDLRMDENWGYNGFGNHNFVASDVESDEIRNFTSFSIEAIGNFGFRIKIPKTPMSLQVGVQYQRGLGNLIDNYTTYVTQDPTSPSSSLLYNTINNLSSTEHVRSLIETSRSVYRQQFKIQVGLLFKL